MSNPPPPPPQAGVETIIERLRELNERPALERWNDPEWRVWASQYSYHEYRESELMAALDAAERELAEAKRIINPDLNCAESSTGKFDYPAAARAIALWLRDYFPEDIPYPQAIAEAARRAAKELTRLLAIEKALPKCWRLNEAGELVQDVPIVPGMTVWVPKRTAESPDDAECLVTGVTNFNACGCAGDGEESFHTADDDCHPDCDRSTPAKEAYASHEAAAARVGRGEVK